MRHSLMLSLLIVMPGCGSDADRMSNGDAPADARTADLSGPPDLVSAELLDITLELPAGEAVSPSDSVPDGPAETLDTAQDLKPEGLDSCTPDCQGKECGADGCGGVCGVCPENKPLCSIGFQCKACKADCEDKECGGDGCGGSCGSCPPGWGCLAGACQPPPCDEILEVWSEAFDSCTEGLLTIQDDQPDDPVTWWALQQGSASPPCALYMGDPVQGSYDTGDPVSLSLLLPPIQLPDDGSLLAFSFSLWMETEPVIAPEYPYDHDTLFLKLSTDGDDWELLFSSKSILNSTDNKWTQIAADLTAWAGQSVQLRFDFDTLDSTENAYTGIFLDDLRVATACPLCLEGDHCDDGDPCSQDLCSLFSNQSKAGICYHPYEASCCNDKEEDFCDDEDDCTLDVCDESTGECQHVPVQGPGCPENE